MVLQASVPQFRFSDVATTYYHQALEVAKHERYQEALTLLDAALEVYPHYYQAWTFRSLVLVHLNRGEEALQSCDNAIALDATEQEAWLFRGVILHQLERYRQAYRSYNRALEQPKKSLIHKWGEFYQSVTQFLGNSSSQLIRFFP